MDLENQIESKTIKIDDELGIQQVSRWKERLLDDLAGVSHLELDLSQVTGADIAGLQLLCSFHRTIVHRQIPFRLCHASSEALSEAMERAGFARKFGCFPEGKDTCLNMVRNRK